MGKNSFIPDSISSARIVSHGKIESLANGFNLPNKEGFTIYARPKVGAEIDTPDIMLSVKCMTDEQASEIPVTLNEWNSLYLESIAPNEEILNSVDLYWGSGLYIVKGKGKYYTEPTAKSLRYSGEAQELVTVGSGTSTVKYRLDGGEWSDSVPTATNVGVYQVEYKMEASDLYDGVESKSLRCAIAEKFVNDPTIELTPSSFTYNGSACVPTVVVKDGQRVIPAEEYTVEITNNVNAGTANVIIHDNIAGNYEVIGSTTFNIAKATRTISFTSAPSSVDIGYTVEVVAAVSAGGGNISYFSSDENVATVEGNVVTGVALGTCNIIASVAANANYEGATAQYQISAVPLDYTNKYLTFVPVEDSTFTFSKAGLSYSLDNGSTWTALEANGTTPTVAAGSKIMWKNNTTLTPVLVDGIGTFSSSKNFDVQGNIMSLLFGDNFINQTSLSEKKYAFSNLFGNSKVRKAESLSLPATTLVSSCYYRMFNNCTSLTTVPMLPTMTLADNCYGGMFRGCTSLTTAPELPATTLVISCYNYMFQGCTSLTTAPVLPATTLADTCYQYMFDGCTSLATAPALPATTLAGGCYYYMFQNCKSLTSAPALPATTLAYSCYGSMFHGCKSLTTAPALPATTLAESCYQAMFQSCTSLTSAPALPATTLADSCYAQMFNDTMFTTAPELPATTLKYRCYYWMFASSKVSYVKMLATDISASKCLESWLYAVPVSGTFVKAEGVEIPRGTSGIPSGWTVEEDIDYSTKYLTFVPVEDSTFGFSKAGLSYSLDNGSTWTALAAATNTPTVAAGSKIMWKNNTTLTPTSSDGIGTFTSSKNFDAQGNVMSLYFGDDFLGQTSLSGKNYAFNSLFGYSKVRNAKNLVLPATTLASYCYNYMFKGCTSLTTAPALPATTLASYCYQYLFYGCTSLTSAPELPATTLAERCYNYMFEDCTSLTSAPALPATTLAENCYFYMFRGCTSLTAAPELPATTLTSGCYYQMFQGCTSLTSAPELPATTLEDYCYAYMFSGCTSLTSAPALPATTLVGNCYKEMFKGCTSLSYVKMLGTDLSASGCISDWLTGVSQTGTFVKNAAATWDESSVIPNGWTVEEDIDYSTKYLTFVPVEDSTFGFSKAGLSYSLDNGSTWTALAAATNTPTVSAGSKIMWKNNTAITPSSSDGIGTFTSSANFDVDGNVMSLLFGDDFAGQTSLSGKNNAFYGLFKNSKARNAENLVLPATTLANHCYYFMFYGCTQLTSAPVLPATELTQNCYYGMFSGCTSLTTAPALPATTLASNCYNNMFNGCISLTAAPVLPATTLAYYCYNGMFSDCTSLTTAPVLPATTLVSNCYYVMFYGCTSLSYVKMLATGISASNCLKDWLNGVSATGTFVKADGVEIPSGKNGIPYGWTVQDV